MATCSGKTRTVIALADVLMRCNWAKRILFLADHVALVKQAVNAFKSHLPDSSPVNLATEKHTDGRVFVSTYPTMMGLIDDAAEGQRRFGVGHFDLIIIDEAHRSVYQKYRAIFDHFDAMLVGLTATPKDEIDHKTYGLFDLEVVYPPMCMAWMKPWPRAIWCHRVVCRCCRRLGTGTGRATHIGIGHAGKDYRD
jgi:type I restriction enzyme R subunit